MNSISKKRILIGCCGGLTGIYLAKCFLKREDFITYGYDSSSLTTGEFFVDRFYQLISASDEKFFEELVELIISEKIDYYLPTHSKEIREVSKFEKELRRRTSVKFLVSPYETFCALESKEQAYYNLISAQIPTPKMITDAPAFFPVIMKGHFGSGGSSVNIINNEKVFSAYKETTSNVSFFEHIEGKEYTVDCVFDTNGKLIAFNLRERIKTIGGAVVISKNSYDFDVLPWLKKLEKSWVFCGCVNFQFIVKDDIPYFIDINLRYPSGGLPLTVKSGINVPEMMIRLMDGENITSSDYPINSNVKIMYRYYDEVYGYDNT